MTAKATMHMQTYTPYAKSHKVKTFADNKTLSAGVITSARDELSVGASARTRAADARRAARLPVVRAHERSDSRLPRAPERELWPRASSVLVGMRVRHAHLS